MGIMTAMTIAIALIIDFLFLPTLLMAFDAKEKTSVPTAEKTSQAA